MCATNKAFPFKATSELICEKTFSLEGGEKLRPFHPNPSSGTRCTKANVRRNWKCLVLKERVWLNDSRRKQLPSALGFFTGYSRIHHYHISHSTPRLPLPPQKALPLSSLGTTNTQERLKTISRMQTFFWGGRGGVGQERCIMGNVKVVNDKGFMYLKILQTLVCGVTIRILWQINSLSF